MSSEVPQRPRLFLERLHIQGFKSIEDLQTNLQKGLNILIGKNGAGKSNFLECLYEVMTTTYQRQIPYRFAQIEIDSSDGHVFKLEFERNLLKYTGDPENLEDRLSVVERLIIDNSPAYSNLSGDDRKPIIFDNKLAVIKSSIWSFFPSLGYPRLTPLNIKFHTPEILAFVDQPAVLRLPIGEMALFKIPSSLGFINKLFSHLFFENAFLENGDITKTWIIKHLKIEKEITENLKLYSPIQDIRFNENINIYKDDKATIIENLKLDFKVNGNWLPWSQLSDGTRRLFYIIAEISNKKDGLVLIEEPELGVHPHQFSLLMDFLKEQAVDKQIIVSTHSPKALDHLSPGELDHIMIASYTSKKGTQINHLNNAQKKKALAYMKEVGFLSDYWMLSDLEQ